MTRKVLATAYIYLTGRVAQVDPSLLVSGAITLL